MLSKNSIHTLRHAPKMGPMKIKRASNITLRYRSSFSNPKSTSEFKPPRCDSDMGANTNVHVSFLVLQIIAQNPQRTGLDRLSSRMGTMITL